MSFCGGRLDRAISAVRLSRGFRPLALDAAGRPRLPRLLRHPPSLAPHGANHRLAVVGRDPQEIGAQAPLDRAAVGKARRFGRRNSEK